MPTPRRSSSARAFTMIELMIVMIIITIVISILVPALGGVRDAARSTQTRGLMQNVVSAAGKFETDKRRLPGYFAPRDMGSQENQTQRGMSAMENIMLDLAGGVVATSGTQPAGTIAVGPRAGPGNEVYVDTKLIGGSGAYFIPPREYFIAQTSDGQQVGVAGHTALAGVDQLPDLCDAWRQPLLAWVKDDSAVAKVDGVNVFLCRENSGSNPANPALARYYWASNAAFLQAPAMGKKGKDQNFVNADIQHSIIGGGVPVANRERLLDGLLGNANYPAFSPPNGPPLHPGEGRAPLIVHSAGSDGFYFGSKDRGAKRVTPMPLAGNATPYSVNFIVPGGSWPAGRYKDKNGQVTIDDVAGDFDDVLVTGSN